MREPSGMVEINFSPIFLQAKPSRKIGGIWIGESCVLRGKVDRNKAELEMAYLEVD